MTEKNGWHACGHSPILQRRSVGHDAGGSIKLSFDRTMDVRKALLIFFGTVCVGLGVLGIFLPLMPTTVFLLLAAYCYSRSSERFHDWLVNNRFLGKYISSYRSGNGISVRQKISTITMLWISIGVSIWLLAASFWPTLMLLAVAVGVTVHLLWIKTYRPEVAAEAITVVPEADKAI